MFERTLNRTKIFLSEALGISLPLFKIMVPITIAVKILKEIGVISFLGHSIAPIMNLVGLPGAMGLVWATAMVTNLYGAIVVFLSLAPGCHLTAGQVTVLTTMMLVAHSLPVELKIAQKAGARLFTLLVLRVAGALLFGSCLSELFHMTGIFHQSNKITWAKQIDTQSLIQWAEAEIRNLVMIFFIILLLLVIMKILDMVGIISLLQRLLAPAMKIVGIGKKAIPLTVVGLTLGLAYGGGLIIKEAQSGAIGKRDAFFSLAFLSLCHGLIEDTLLMMTLGGRLVGILVARIFLSFLLIFPLVRVTTWLKAQTFERYFYK